MPDTARENSNSEVYVERVDPAEIDTIAKVLAIAYTNDPIHVWAMPKAETRQADAILFFKFYLRRMQQFSWDVFATSDRSAVLVTSTVRNVDSPYPDGVRYLPGMMRSKSVVNDYLQWVESHRPKIDHRYTEFLGALPNAPRGVGFFLFRHALKIFDQEGLPVWTWSSNRLNLPFYRRLGFEIQDELHWKEGVPPVTIIYRPVMPVGDPEQS